VAGVLKLLRSAWHEYERDYARYYAAAVVFYTLIALIPLLLLLLSGVGLLLQHSELVASRADQLLKAVEAGFGANVRDTVERLSEQLRQGSIVAIVVSVAGLLVTASKLFHHLRMTFRAIWRHESPLLSGTILTVVWGAFLEKSKAFLVLLACGGLLLVAFVLDTAMHWVALRTSWVPWLGEPIARLLAVVVVLALAPVTFALLFRYLPPVTLGWRHIWLASLLCGGAWLIGFELFALYGANFGRQFGAYGALGGVLVAMIWMNVMAQVLFIGAELCKIVAQRDGVA